MYSPSQEEIDLHLSLLPVHSWRKDLNYAYPFSCEESKSIGVLRKNVYLEPTNQVKCRIGTNTTLFHLRDIIKQHLDTSLLPNHFMYLFNTGRCLTRISPKQEKIVTIEMCSTLLKSMIREIYLIDIKCLLDQEAHFAKKRARTLPPLSYRGISSCTTQVTTDEERFYSGSSSSSSSVVAIQDGYLRSHLNSNTICSSQAGGRSVSVSTDGRHSLRHSFPPANISKIGLSENNEPRRNEKGSSSGIRKSFKSFSAGNWKAPDQTRLEPMPGQTRLEPMPDQTRLEPMPDPPTMPVPVTTADHLQQKRKNAKPQFVRVNLELNDPQVMETTAYLRQYLFNGGEKSEDATEADQRAKGDCVEDTLKNQAISSSTVEQCKASAKRKVEDDKEDTKDCKNTEKILNNNSNSIINTAVKPSVCVKDNGTEVPVIQVTKERPNPLPEATKDKEKQPLERQLKTNPAERDNGEKDAITKRSTVERSVIQERQQRTSNGRQPKTEPGVSDKISKGKKIDEKKIIGKTVKSHQGKGQRLNQDRITALISEIERVKKECGELNDRKGQMLLSLRKAQLLLKTNREKVSDEWRKRYHQEKQHTAILEDQIRSTRRSIDLLTSKRGSNSHMKGNSLSKQREPYEIANLRNQCVRFEQEIQGLKQQLNQTQRRLTVEKEMRRNMASDYRLAKKQLLDKSIEFGRTAASLQSKERENLL